MAVKALLLVAVLLLLYWFVTGSRSARRGAESEDKRGRASPENMVSCAYCGLHLPESEAIAIAGHHFCCDEHHQASGR